MCLCHISGSHNPVSLSFHNHNHSNRILVGYQEACLSSFSSVTIPRALVASIHKKIAHQTQRTHQQKYIRTDILSFHYQAYSTLQLKSPQTNQGNGALSTSPHGPTGLATRRPPLQHADTQQVAQHSPNASNTHTLVSIHIRSTLFSQRSVKDSPTKTKCTMVHTTQVLLSYSVGSSVNTSLHATDSSQPKSTQQPLLMAQ